MADISHGQILLIIAGLMKFPYPQICRHLVACDLLSLLEEHGYKMPDGLAESVCRADDERALEILENEG